MLYNVTLIFIVCNFLNTNWCWLNVKCIWNIVSTFGRRWPTVFSATFTFRVFLKFDLKHIFGTYDAVVINNEALFARYFIALLLNCTNNKHKTQVL